MYPTTYKVINDCGKEYCLERKVQLGLDEKTFKLILEKVNVSTNLKDVVFGAENHSV